MKKNIHTAPQSMNMNVMQQLLRKTIQDNPYFYAGRDFALVAGIDLLSRVFSAIGGAPFFIEDYRMGILLRGEIDVTVNLIDYHITPGQMVFLGRGSIIQPHHVSDDTLIKGFVLSPDLVSQIVAGVSMPLLAGSATAFYQNATAADRKFFENLMLTIWTLVHAENYPTSVLHALFSALLEYYNQIYIAVTNLPEQRKGNTALFNRFITLVNEYSDCERSIAFYADRLCLSPRYFSTLVQEQSGKPAKHWIDTAVTTRAKILLRHSDKTISQITSELHFPNDSFFCKFFRRLTGMSPTEYRENGYRHQ